MTKLHANCMYTFRSKTIVNKGYCMYKYAKDGVSTLTILDTRRSKASGLYPVKIQVVHLRKQKYYSTGKELSLTDWDALSNTKSKNLLEIRKDIQSSFDIVKDTIQELCSKEGFSFDALNNRLSKGASDSINGMFQNKIETLKANDQVGSAIYYQNVLTSIEKFKGDNIQISSITADWLKSYEKHMLGKSNSYTTIGMHSRAIRTIMNEAKKVGLIKANQYPFGKGQYEIPTSESRKMALTLQQIRQVISFADGNEATEKYRDLWFFSYLCNGINFTDMLQLKYSNILNGEISFRRAKTIRTSKVKKELYAMVTPEMQQIIERWGNEDKSPNSYIFPYLKGNETPVQINNITKEVVRRCNKKLKVIASALNIDHISTYTARHSYATVLKRSGANIAYISESLGHSDLKTTENYLASFEHEERKKNAKLLTNFDGL